jgi:Flp pilus assembly protein TadG
VTAEMAVGLPVLALVVGGALWAVVAVGVQVECADAARAGARAAARGEPLEAVRRMVARAAPAGAVISVTRDPTLSRVTISAAIRPGRVSLIPEAPIKADATSATEPGAASASEPGAASVTGSEAGFATGPREASATGPGTATAGEPGAEEPGS